MVVATQPLESRHLLLTASSRKVWLNLCTTAGVMAGTAACGSLTATNTRRVVIERVAIGAIVRRVDTGLGDDDCLGRGDALLRIEARSSERRRTQTK